MRETPQKLVSTHYILPHLHYVDDLKLVVVKI